MCIHTACSCSWTLSMHMIYTAKAKSPGCWCSDSVVENRRLLISIYMTSSITNMHTHTWAGARVCAQTIFVFYYYDGLMGYTYRCKCNIKYIQYQPRCSQSSAAFFLQPISFFRLLGSFDVCVCVLVVCYIRQPIDRHHGINVYRNQVICVRCTYTLARIA